MRERARIRHAHDDFADVSAVRGGEGMVSMYARESLPPNKDARSWSFERDLRVQFPCRYIKVSIYPSIYWVVAGALRGAVTARRKKVDIGTGVGGW